MAKFYYNDVLLPEIPAELLAQYPYRWIKLAFMGKDYELILSPYPWYFATKLYTQQSSYLVYKVSLEQLETDGAEWKYAITYNDNGNYSVDYGMTWSSHDIPNGSADATEIYFHGNEPVPDSGGEAPDILYTVYGSSLTAVADAIRVKGGTTGELAFPDGYVSAIEDISSVSDLSNVKDIAFGGNESGGKYVIEDETITPLFDQIQRVTKTEEALTFEEATASLLNVVPGGDLPNAEEAGFGVDSGELEFGITAATCYNNAYFGETAGWTFKATQAISIVGLRYYENFSTSYPHVLKLWNSSGECVAEIECPAQSSGAWTDVVYLDTPVNIGIGETYTVSERLKTYNDRIGLYYANKNTVTFNPKISYQTSVKYNGFDGFPDYDLGTGYIPLVDLIIGLPQVELPDDYQVKRTTMDDIAYEVQRISGTIGKMTISQILTTLQSIQLQDKSVILTNENETVTPDSNYYGLSSVDIDASQILDDASEVSF